jgi:hypothetical protein
MPVSRTDYRSDKGLVCGGGGGESTGLVGVLEQVIHVLLLRLGHLHERVQPRLALSCTQ